MIKFIYKSLPQSFLRKTACVPIGETLREEAEKIPYAMGCLVNKKGTLFTLEEAEALKEQLYRILRALE